MPELARAEGCRLVLLAGTSEYVDAPSRLWQASRFKAESKQRTLVDSLDRACDGSKVIKKSRGSFFVSLGFR